MNGTKTRAPDSEMPMLEADAAEVRIDWLLEVGFVASLPVVLIPPYCCTLALDFQYHISIEHRS